MKRWGVLLTGYKFTEIDSIKWLPYGKTEFGPILYERDDKSTKQLNVTAPDELGAYKEAMLWLEGKRK